MRAGPVHASTRSYTLVNIPAIPYSRTRAKEGGCPEKIHKIASYSLDRVYVRCLN